MSFARTITRNPTLTTALQTRPLTATELQSLPLNAAEKTIANFIARYRECGTAEQIGRFIQLVKAANWKGIDIHSVVRALKLGGTIAGPYSTPSRTRTGGLELIPETQGRRGKRGSKVLPSVLWEVAVENCGNLDALNAGIQSVLQGTYGLTVPLAPLQLPSDAPPTSAEENQALGDFFVAHPECTANRAAINRLLNLIDEHHLNGTDMYALFRTLGLERHLPELPRSGAAYRVDRMSVTDRAAPRRGKQLESNVFKSSLLWMLLSEYCGQMDEVVKELNNILSSELQASRLGVSATGALPSIQPRPKASRARSNAGGRQRRNSATAASPYSSPLSSLSSPTASPRSAMSISPPQRGRSRSPATRAPNTLFGSAVPVTQVDPFAPRPAAGPSFAPASRFRPQM